MIVFVSMASNRNLRAIAFCLSVCTALLPVLACLPASSLDSGASTVVSISDKNDRTAGATSSGPPLAASVSKLDSMGGGKRDFRLGAQRTVQQAIGSYMFATELRQAGARGKSVKPEIYRGWLAKAHPRFALRASSTSPNSVVVVRGTWDNSGKTLKKLGIPFKKISSKDITSYSLNKARVVIVDCAGEMSRPAMQKLRDFVARGGFLLSTDWALDNFVSVAFREYIVWNKAKNSHPIYDATVVDADPVLFKQAVTNAHWKLDFDSHLITVVNRDAVRVHVVSRSLAREDPGRLGALAVSFPFGRGYVLHMLGHFDNNSMMPFGNRLPDPAPVIDISLRQALAANFVVAGLTGRRIPTRHNR